MFFQNKVNLEFSPLTLSIPKTREKVSEELVNAVEFLHNVIHDEGEKVMLRIRATRALAMVAQALGGVLRDEEKLRELKKEIDAIKREIRSST